MKILFVFNFWYLIIISNICKINIINTVLWNSSMFYVIFTILVNIDSPYIIGIMIVQLTMIISFLIMIYSDVDSNTDTKIYWNILEALPPYNVHYMFINSNIYN